MAEDEVAEASVLTEEVFSVVRFAAFFAAAARRAGDDAAEDEDDDEEMRKRRSARTCGLGSLFSIARAVVSFLLDNTICGDVRIRPCVCVFVCICVCKESVL